MHTLVTAETSEEDVVMSGNE